MHCRGCFISPWTDQSDMRIPKPYSVWHCRNVSKCNLNCNCGWLIPWDNTYIPDDSLGCNKMYDLPWWIAVLTHMYLASHKKGYRETEQTQIKTPPNAASYRGPHCLLTGNHIRMKMKQDTWHPLNDTWIHPIDKDGYSIKQIWVNRFTGCAIWLKSVFLVVLSLPR